MHIREIKLRTAYFQGKLENIFLKNIAKKPILSEVEGALDAGAHA